MICSFWLVDNLTLAGQAKQARALFERLLGYANDVGLLAEEIDPASGELLGNFPQAFSHVGLISAPSTSNAAAEPPISSRVRLPSPSVLSARILCHPWIALLGRRSQMPQAQDSVDTENAAVQNLAAAAAELLERAAAAPAGRAALTLVPGAGAPLKQTLLALRSGAHLAEHEAPGAATLHVLRGRVRLVTSGQRWELGEADHIQIPPTRHRLEGLEDAAVLLTVATTPSG